MKLPICDADWELIVVVFKLSRRESEIAQRIVQGYDECHIARDLNIARDTVRTYKRRLYGKLGAQSHATVVTTVFDAYVRFAQRR